MLSFSDVRDRKVVKLIKGKDGLSAMSPFDGYQYGAVRVFGVSGKWNVIFALGEV